MHFCLLHSEQTIRAFSSQALIASLRNMFQHAFSVILVRVCVCCDPASSCDLLKEADCSEGERRHLHPRALLFLLLRPSALLVAVGDAGDQPRRRSARSSSGSDTSCCVGSLGVASGSALPSCLLEYNCLLLIFFS